MPSKVWSDGNMVFDRETWQAIGVIAAIAVASGVVSALVTHWLIG